MKILRIDLFKSTIPKIFKAFNHDSFAEWLFQLKNI